MPTSTKRKTTSKKKTATKKTTAKKPNAKRKYSPGASEAVAEEMRDYNAGTARSGRSGTKVENRKQAIAIGLAEARKRGERVPPPPDP